MQPASLADLPAYPSDFTFRRFITFAGIVLGYSCFYLTRNSLTYTAPAMVQDATLGIGMKEASGVGRLEEGGGGGIFVVEEVSWLPCHPPTPSPTPHPHTCTNRSGR